MKINQILDTMLSTKYVLVRLNFVNKRVALNTGIIHIDKVINQLNKSKGKHIVSITPCNFNEYISNKIPFHKIYKS